MRENTVVGANPSIKEIDGVVGTARERRRPGPRPRSIAERLWEKVDRNGPTMPGMESPCWVFTGTKSDDGYGSISSGGHSGKMLRAHRVAWELENGPIPEGVELCHRCDNPPCCRPSHHFLGTHSENMLDASGKGRLPTAPRRASKNRGERNGRARLTAQQAAAIRNDPRNALEAAAAFGISRHTVHAIRQGRIWRDAA